MLEPWRIRRAAENQLGNMRMLLSGEPLALTPLGAMSLDLADILNGDPVGRVLPNQSVQFRDRSAIILTYSSALSCVRRGRPPLLGHELGVDAGVKFTDSIRPVEGTLPYCPRAAEAVATCVNFPCLLP